MSDFTNQLREPKDHRLFHYTRKLEHLEDMIRNGLWPRYCEEDFEWLLGKPVTLAFPMVCFCDIPPDAAKTHRNRYGGYALGISKECAGMLDINPLWYVHRESTIGMCLAGSLAMKDRFELAKLDGNLVRDLLPFLKPTNGTQIDRLSVHPGVFESFAFEEEMEWRHTPPALAKRWFQSDRRGFVNETDHHALSKPYRMKLELRSIECVFVPRLGDVSALENEFPELKQKIAVWQS